MGRHKGSGDHDRNEQRLKIWKDRALRGVRRADIAVELGMSLVALDQMVYRHRSAGNPLAVYHINAQFKDPNPSRHNLAHREYRARLCDRQRAERAIRARATLGQVSTDC